jgi:hypothetical protein
MCQITVKEDNASDKDPTNESLLHKALKRKRTDSENESLMKRQFLIAKPNYPPLFNKPSLLTSALTSPPKAMSKNYLITRSSLLKSHVELASLLKKESKGNSIISATTSSTTKLIKDEHENLEVKNEEDC